MGEALGHPPHPWVLISSVGPSPPPQWARGHGGCSATLPCPDAPSMVSGDIRGTPSAPHEHPFAVAPDSWATFLPSAGPDDCGGEGGHGCHQDPRKRRGAEKVRAWLAEGPTDECRPRWGRERKRSHGCYQDPRMRKGAGGVRGQKSRVTRHASASVLTVLGPSAPLHRARRPI